MIPWAASDRPCISSHLLLPIHLPCCPSLIPGLGAQTPVSGPGAFRTSFWSLSSVSASSPAPWALPKLLRGRVRVWKGALPLLWRLGADSSPIITKGRLWGAEGSRWDSRFLQPLLSGPCGSLLQPEIKPVSPAVGARSPYHGTSKEFLGDSLNSLNLSLGRLADLNEQHWMY